MKLRKSVRTVCQKENDPKPRGRKRCGSGDKSGESGVESKKKVTDATVNVIQSKSIGNNKIKTRASSSTQATKKYYTVDAVLGKRIGPGGKIDYLLKWTGFSDDFNSWECADNLDENSLKEYRELDNVVLINKCISAQKDVYILKDVPKKIVETRKVAIDGEIEFLVEWCKESDLNWLPACIMKQSFPKLISDFYETKSH